MADINITPMVDVMLVLLVIFMVTAPMLMAGVHVDLPRSKAPKIDPQPKPIVVTMALDGALYVGDDKVDRGNLLLRLSELKTKGGDAAAYVRADAKIAYGDVMQLLGQIGEAGFTRISLVSRINDAKTAAASAGGTQ